MSKLNGKNVLITGGAAGIGKLMAKLSLEREANVIIWDINPNSLNSTVNELSALGNVAGYEVDVTNLEQIQKTAATVKAKHGVIDVLINNAGIVVGKYFHEHSTTDIERTIAVNTTAPMHITNAFLPDMIAQNSGHICTIASSAGLVSNPKMSVYAASKWAAFAWNDSIRLEMEQLGKKVKVTSILPYYINTGMFDGVKSRIPILEPKSTALTIIKAIEKNKAFITLPSWVYNITRLSQALMPVKLYDWFAGSVLGIYHSMSEFKGHKK